MRIDEICEAYRQGDADKRLSLFLFHRECRDLFASIEQEDAGDLQKAPRPRWTLRPGSATIRTSK